MKTKREYYKIRLLDKVGEWNEYHRSNNGTDHWGTLSKVKAVLTRGIGSGYKSRIRSEFEGFEVVKFTETVQTKTEIVTL